MTLTPFGGSPRLTSVESIEGFPRSETPQIRTKTSHQRWKASWAAESKAGRVQAHAGSDQEGLAGTHRPKQSRERPARTNEDREDRTQGVLAYFARGVF